MSPQDRYVDSIFTRYQVALREQLSTLAEPTITSRAHHKLDAMIETLTAFAIGHAVGRVVEAVRRLDGTLARPLADAIARVAPPSPEQALPPPRFLADKHRPIIDMLGGLLHQRLALAARHARVLVRALAAELDRRGRPEVLPRVLPLLDDPAAAYGFADQLVLGWQFFLAASAELPDPELPDEPRWMRGRALWSAWSRRVRGTRPAPTREYILRVA